MDERDNNIVWRFYRTYTAIFLTLLFAVGIAIVLGGIFLGKSPFSAVAIGIGTSFIASVIFATFTRYFLEKDFEYLLSATVEKSLSDSSDKILQRIDLKVDYLQKFMPNEPFVGRDKASDIVERKAYDLYLKCRRYRSYGITAKYAVYRMHRAIIDAPAQASLNAKDIVLYVAHPAYIKKPIIYDPSKKLKELLGSMAFIDETLIAADEKVRLSVEVQFILPLPILRFDAFEGDKDYTLVYMYEDISADQTRLPDAGLYEKNSHWCQLAQDIMLSYDNQTLVRWHNSHRPEHSTTPGDDLVQIPDFTQTTSLSEILQKHFRIQADEIEAAKQSFKQEFMTAMDKFNFKGP